MNLEEKILKIKKSCKVGATVSNILFVIAMVGCILAFIAGIYILRMGRGFDEKIIQAEAEGYVSTGVSVGVVKIADVELIDVSNIKTSIPQLEDDINDHPYCIAYSIFVLTMAVLALIYTIMMKVISKTFALIENEDNPFTDKVIRRVVTVMIVVTAVALLSNGFASGALCAILTWVIYTVMDYGKLLQIQSDETI